MAKNTAALATEDVLVDAPHATEFDIAALKAGAVQPIPTDVMDALQSSLEDTISKQRPVKNVTPKPKAIAAPAKKVAAPKAKTEKKVAVRKPVERMSADVFVAELKRLGLSKSEAAQALGCSSSLISEYVGNGRHQTLRKDRWPEAKTKLASFAKNLKATK